MKQISLQTAKKISQKYISKIQDPEQREFIKLHTRKVVDTAKLLGKKYNLNITHLEIAGWLHDIGYAINMKNHAQESLKLLSGYRIDPVIKDCILNHGIGKTPKTKEGKIFQAADKVSFFDHDIIELILKTNPDRIKKADLRFLDLMAGSAIKLLQKLK